MQALGVKFAFVAEPTVETSLRVAEVGYAKPMVRSVCRPPLRKGRARMGHPLLALGLIFHPL
jgi:hypothetical protein